MKKTYIVDESFNDARIDRWIRNKLGKFPQGLIEKNLRNGKIKLNKKKVKSSIKLKTNDIVYVYNLNFKEKIYQKNLKFSPSNEIIKKNEDLIIDNNDDFVVINKSSGISVQGGTKSKKNLIDIFSKSQIFFNLKPFSVHRLDKETSGILIIAKHRKAAQLLTSLFRLRRMHKTYIAICLGELNKNTGILKNNLIRYENGKKIVEEAITSFKVLDKNNFCTLVLLKPITGRKHQLRKQLFLLGNSIVGDLKYNSTSVKHVSKNLMLHSYQIKFMINDKKYTYIASLPDHFKKILSLNKLKFLNLK